MAGKEVFVFLCTLAWANAYYLNLDGHTRVVGGQQADPNEWPWQVSLQRRSFFGSYSHICGGSLIAPNYVLTAAHCVDGSSRSSLRIVAGLHQQSVTSGATAYSIAKILMHLGYDGNGAGFPNDIALLKLSSNVGNNKADTVALARSVDSFYGNPDCWITGWGKTSASSGTAETLMEAQMDVIDNGDCSAKWRGISGATIMDSHICIEAEGKSSCNGDSGGPLVCRNNGQYVLAGVTSWGITTCEGYPSVYVRVSKFLDWIQDTMNSN